MYTVKICGFSLLVRHPRVECDLRVTCNLALKGEVAPILDNLANHSVSLTILVVDVINLWP